MKYDGLTVLCYGRGELDMQVRALSDQGYRIIAVFMVMDEMFTIVAQKEIPE